MDIRSLGSTGFEVKCSAGTILIDPDPKQIPGTFTDSNTVIVFTITTDEKAPKSKGASQVIIGPGEYEIGGISIKGVATPADDPTISRKINTVYVIHGDGIAVCALGALGSSPDNLATQQIGKINILLIDPDKSLVGADDLAAMVRTLEPDVIAPSGYDVKTNQPGKAMKALLTELGAKSTEAISKYSTTLTALPEQRTTVILSPKN